MTDCFERFPCDAVFGLHNHPGLPVGQFHTSDGIRFAGGAVFDITITGQGAHGARPQASIDPVLVACHLGTALQSIVARNISAQDTAVLSVTRIHAGQAYNVIPQSALMAGTVRTMQPEVMTIIEHNMKRLAVSMAAGFRAEAVVNFRTLFAPVVNDPHEAALYADAAAALVGDANVRRNAPPSMASEDFGCMMQTVPGAHVLVGNGEGAAVHNHLYDFNDEAIPFGAALFAAITETKLRQSI